MTNPIIHCSNLPLLAKCRGGFSSREDSHGNEYTQEGRAFHKALYMKLQGKTNFSPVKTEFGLSQEAFSEICSFANRFSLGIPEGAFHLAEHKMELELEHCTLSGTPDLIIVHNRTLYVVDYKYGRVEVEPDSPQLIGYAGMFLRTRKEYLIEKVVLQVAQPRLGLNNQKEFTLEEFNTLFDVVVTICNEAITIPEFTTGEHCGSCNKKFSCPANEAKTKSLTLLSGCKDVKQALFMFYPQIKMLEKMIEQVKDTAKEYVEEHGELVLNDGSRLVFEEGFKDSLDHQKTISFLQQNFSLQEILEMANLTKSGIMDYCKAKERGLAGKVLQDMKLSGCIVQKSTRQLKMKGKDK